MDIDYTGPPHTASKVHGIATSPGWILADAVVTVGVPSKNLEVFQRSTFG